MNGRGRFETGISPPFTIHRCCRHHYSCTYLLLPFGATMPSRAIPMYEYAIGMKRPIACFANKAARRRKISLRKVERARRGEESDLFVHPYSIQSIHGRTHSLHPSLPRFPYYTYIYTYITLLHYTYQPSISTRSSSSSSLPPASKIPRFQNFKISMRANLCTHARTYTYAILHQTKLRLPPPFSRSTSCLA